MDEYTGSIYDAAARDSLREALVERRKELGLRQSDIAEALGVGQPSISELERGYTSPKFETLQRYARAIDASIEFEVVVNYGSTESDTSS